MSSHAAVAALGTGDDELVRTVLADWRTAPVNDKVRATLGFLEKVTLFPGKVGPADIAPLRAAGVGDTAIREALYVCFLFNLMDRLADAFDFPLPDAEGYRKGGQVLYRLGYGLSSIPG